MHIRAARAHVCVLYSKSSFIWPLQLKLSYALSAQVSREKENKIKIKKTTPTNWLCDRRASVKYYVHGSPATSIVFHVELMKLG